MFKVKVKSFTGKAFSLEVEPSTTVAALKTQVIQTKAVGKSSQCVLAFNGHELREHQLLNHYGVKEGDTLHIIPPSREPKITLQFENGSDDLRKFELSVRMNITVAQLQAEIAIEEAIEVTQLKLVTTADKSVHESDDEEEREDDGLVISSLVSLEPDCLLSIYPLEGEVITVYSHPYSITVVSRGSQVTYSIAELKPISQLHIILRRDSRYPESTHYALSWNGNFLDEMRTFAELRIPSGSVLHFGVPSKFSIRLAMDMDGTQKILNVSVKAKQTLSAFRDLVLEEHSLPISQDVLILVGNEITGEDIALEDLGFQPECTIHAVGYISFEVEADFDTFEPMLMHPLTRLSAIRNLLVANRPDIPLNMLWFTLDGKKPLKESRTLWDLGIISGCTLYLHTRDIALTVVVWDRPSQNTEANVGNSGRAMEISGHPFTDGRMLGTYELYADESELVSEFEERALEVAGIQEGIFRFRHKDLDKKRTLKAEGFEGGETVNLYQRHPEIYLARKTSARARAYVRPSHEQDIERLRLTDRAIESHERQVTGLLTTYEGAVEEVDAMSGRAPEYAPDYPVDLNVEHHHTEDVPSYGDSSAPYTGYLQDAKRS